MTTGKQSDLRSPLPAGVLSGGEFTSAADVWDRSARAATALASLGVAAGDAVALLMRNDRPFVEASFAAAMLGASPVPVNWHGTAAEVDYIVSDSGAKVLVAHHDLLEALGPRGESVAVVGVATPDAIRRRYGLGEATHTRAAVEWSRWIETFAPWEGERPAVPFAMLYTSGTTGRPKGVRRFAFDERQAEATRLLIDERNAIMGFAPGMRSVITGPMYHTAPNAYALGAVREGGFVALQARFDAEELLVLIERHRITHLSLVPTMFVRLLKLDASIRDRHDVSSLVHVVHGAAPCPPDVKRRMIEWWGPIIHEYYGGTESGLVAGCSSPEWLTHPGTVGKVLQSAVVRIYDDDGREAQPGEIGDVFMRSRGMPDFTYQGSPRERAECERDGLITCGDVGYLDEDGFLYLCDRRRDMVISGGVNIYPVEIEACILAMPQVRDCAVFGVPDSEYGEALAAAIELEAGEVATAADVQSAVREHLAGYKVPRIVTFHDELPREDSGKIFKRKLREPFWAGKERRVN